MTASMAVSANDGGNRVTGYYRLMGKKSALSAREGRRVMASASLQGMYTSAQRGVGLPLYKCPADAIEVSAAGISW